MHSIDKYSQQGSIIYSVWLNGWVFVSKLNGCGFESCCCHLKVFWDKIETAFILLMRSIWINYEKKQTNLAYKKFTEVLLTKE